MMRSSSASGRTRDDDMLRTDMESPLGCLNTRGCGSRSALRTALSGVTFSAQGRTDGVHQLLARRPLPHVSQRTGLETKLHQQRIAMNGHEHDPCGALLGSMGAAAAMPVEAR